MDLHSANGITYGPEELPFGRKWSDWASIWCSWLLSIPKSNNPALDNSGKYSALRQPESDVWFLAGTFGNESIIERKCNIPKGKAIFFPTILKECSFAEDTDLKTEEELVDRSKSDMDMVTSVDVQLSMSGTRLIEQVRCERFQSKVFDLTYPTENVYDMAPITTKSTCNGYWVFLRPLPIGIHRLTFRVEAVMPKDYVVTKQMQHLDVYRPVGGYIEQNESFKIEVRYEITVK